jgi:predicted transposase YdaD
VDTDSLFHELFLNLLLQRFKAKSREEIRKMIAELTPLHETRAGLELLEEGIEKGIESLVRRMSSKGRSPAEISDLTDLPVEQISRILQTQDH